MSLEQLRKHRLGRTLLAGNRQQRIRTAATKRGQEPGHDHALLVPERGLVHLLVPERGLVRLLVAGRPAAGDEELVWHGAGVGRG